MMSQNCWIIGSAVVDTVFFVPNLPKEGQSVIARKVEKFLGGKGVNQAVAAARSGANTHIIGAVGNDSDGQLFKEILRSEAMDTQYLISIDGIQTGQASISVSDSGQNTISIFPGANMALPSQLVENACIESADFTLCQLEIPDAVLLEISKRGKFIFNPAPFRNFPLDVLSRCYIVTPNESEAEAITQIQLESPNSYHEVCDYFLTRGVQNVILTLGERGVFWKSTRNFQHFIAPSVNAVDATGAGDVFNGSLIARLSLGDTIESAIPYAVAAASLSVTKVGAIPSIPNKEEVLSFMSVRNN